MQTLAYVDGTRSPPFKGGRGVCGGCGCPVIAKCGDIKVHHWAHEAGADCDTWSEGMGDWHLSWQSLADPAYVEYVIKPHRADILGNNDTVIELQHSPISPDEIREREAFYGNMIWLFDATYRFAAMRLGNRCFFRLGNTQHVHFCTKQVYLDFGEYIVQVERLPPKGTLKGISGYGLIRDRRWLCEKHLCDRTNLGANISSGPEGRTSADAWSYPLPWSTLKFPSRWMVEGCEVLYPVGEPYIPLVYYWIIGQRHEHQWERIILTCPEIANGWTTEDCKEMKLLLSGQEVILGGRLCVMPGVPFKPSRGLGEKWAKELVAKAREHARNGRIPLLKDETFESILDVNTPQRPKTEVKQTLFGEFGPVSEMQRL